MAFSKDHPSFKWAMDSLRRALERAKLIGDKGREYSRQQRRRDQFQETFASVSQTARAEQYQERRTLTMSRSERRAMARDLCKPVRKAVA
jgi:erythromycin esterase-like protein